MENEEKKITEGELKELKRKITSINELVLVTNVLEKDKQAYLADVIKSHGLDPAVVYNVDLTTGAITGPEKKPEEKPTA